jgi:hypothetical protein
MGDEEPATKADVDHLMAQIKAMMGAICRGYNPGYTKVPLFMSNIYYICCIMRAGY